jgi:hypothetical protein
LFSKTNQLQFNTYDQNHPEVQILKNLAEGNQSEKDRELSDDELEKVQIKKG